MNASRILTEERIYKLFMRDFLQKMLTRYRELILYVFFGGVTTLVNFAAYWLFTDVLHVHYLVSNVLAWLLSVIAAFVSNKAVVFADARVTPGVVAAQFLSFAGFRAATGALETGLLWVGVDCLRINDKIIKLAAAVIVVVTNYIFSKLVIFRKSKKEKE